MYAEVAVNSPVAQPRTFSYAIPQGLELESGHAVWVPFGPRLVQGIVFSVTETPLFEDTKPIDKLISPYPLLKPYQIELAQWIGDYYLAPYFYTASLMLPLGFERKLLTYFNIDSKTIDIHAKSSTDQQKSIIELIGQKGRIELKELNRALGKRRVENDLRFLLNKGLIRREYEIAQPKVGPKYQEYIKLDISIKDVVELIKTVRSDKQKFLLTHLTEATKPVPATVARRDFSTKSVRSLLKKGVISIEKVKVHRDPLAHYSFQTAMPPILTPAQETIWQQLKASIDNTDETGKNVFLLHGVTGSGKTEIYLRALEEVVAKGKRGIVLVPEISLTPQTITRFASRFPDRVAVLHSKLSAGERYDEWYRIKEGLFDVVVGSRGAIFASQPDLGLIVIDEEHEWTYKQQEQSPRYHSSDVAVKLSEMTGATVILGSATPDVGSYYRAKNGTYHLLELPERIAKEERKELPKVELIDMRDELKKGNRSIFSRSLSESISETLAAKEQVILFLNRRGTASFVQCRDCGHVISCHRCQVAMTYHSAEQGLICHQCNYRTPTPNLCPSCKSRRIKFLGVGTQKVAEEVTKWFKTARILRWDRDVTKGKRSHEEILDKFLAHQADILIGTQMVAKGLDMPLVTLVGVISADIALHLPDFRAGERTFQILTQVAGRAGRDIQRGKVVIQTYNPNHYAIAAASKQDYNNFYSKEISYRRQLNNPPFSKLALLLYTHTNAERCQQEAKRLFELLTHEINTWGLANTSLIGPSPSFIERLRGRYRWQIVIRSQNPLELLSKVAVPNGWSVDIDPVSLL
ncbi:primosomal protein N' [Chloroflexota bacterium]